MMFLTSESGQVFLSFNSILHASSKVRENWDFGLYMQLYAGSNGIKLASKVFYFSDFSSKIFKAGVCRTFEIEIG